MLHAREPDLLGVSLWSFILIQFTQFSTLCSLVLNLMVLSWYVTCRRRMTWESNLEVVYLNQTFS